MRDPAAPLSDQSIGPNDWLTSVRTYEAKRLPDEGSADGVMFTGKPCDLTGRSAVGESRRAL